MSLPETVLPASAPPVMAGFSSLVLAPILYLLGLVTWKRTRDASRSQAEMEAALDDLLLRDSETLRERTRANPLAFAPSEDVSPSALGLKTSPEPARVEIVRTVRAALDNGYRIRLRARVTAARGRTMMRSREIDLLRQC
jgi:hypothetical protein